MYQSKEEQKEYTKCMKKAKTILKRLQTKANNGDFYENFGQKEYSKFRESIDDNEILSYGSQSDIAGYLSEMCAQITPNYN